MSPTDVIYTAISLMQKWSALLKGKDKERILQVANGIVRWLRKFKPSVMVSTDVIEF